MKEGNRKINLNIHMYIFNIIATITIINDSIIFFSKLNYNCSFFISCILTIILNLYLFRNNKIKVESNFNKIDLIIIMPYLIIFLIIALKIDDFVDTIAYHLYNQRNPFIDRINFDLLPSSSFFFPLGDRMHYIFVRFLGYRLGCVLSAYTAIIIFYQIKRYLTIIIPDISDKCKIIFGAIVLYTFSVNLCIGTYNIDFFSMIILLEIVYISINDINIFKSKNYLYFSVFLSGLAVGIKISNLVFVVPILFYIILKNFKDWKKIKFYDVIIVFSLFFIPFLVYIINSYRQTGNPIFPFYNYIFKSKYYEQVSGKDMRLGANGFLQTISWPIKIFMNPLIGDDIRGIVDPIWVVGYIISIIYIIKKDDNKKIKYLAILSVIMTLLWTILASGYVRYAMFIPILYFLIELYSLRRCIIKVKKKVNELSILDLLAKFTVICIITLELFFSVMLGFTYLCLLVSNSLYIYKYNIEEEKMSDKYDIDGVWISSRYNVECIDLIREKNDPMYNIDIIAFEDPMMKVQSNYSDYAKEKFYEKIKRKRVIYCN